MAVAVDGPYHLSAWDWLIAIGSALVLSSIMGVAAIVFLFST